MLLKPTMTQISTGTSQSNDVLASRLIYIESENILQPRKEHYVTHSAGETDTATQTKHHQGSGAQQQVPG